MKKLYPIFLTLLLSTHLFAQSPAQVFVSQDVENFWVAYDRIVAAKDSNEQYALLKNLYLDKGTEGLKGLMEVRNYNAKDFIYGINQYPRFWASLRKNTQHLSYLYPVIDAQVQKLKAAYPELQPATIYFSVGAFRTNGTIQGRKILIGSELSLADSSTVIDELPAWRQPYYKTQHPVKELPLLCVHEYVHTQQKEPADNLLSYCLYEGAAEFISCKVTGIPSYAPAIEFGKANQQRVVKQFTADLFIMSNVYNWLWGENSNDLKVRDLGYYIGYEICERYYNHSADKTKAIKELIELDYTNEEAIERIVDATQLLPRPLDSLYSDYEQSRPTVVKITPFENGSQSVKPGLTKITVYFSAPLLRYNTGIDYGPLGEEHFPKLQPERVFSNDGTAWTFEADLQPNRHYQIVISNNFRMENGVRLKPYLIDFKTGE